MSLDRMSRTSRSTRRSAVTITAVTLTALLSLGLIAPRSGHAQPRRSDYLLGRPKATLTLRIGAARPNASNGVFAFADSLLTLGPDNYLGANFGADIGVPITQRFELQLSASNAASRVDSEYRDFVDNRDLPIEQATRLRRTPISMGLRYNFVPAGRSVSRLAWVPTRFVPFVAAGGGAMQYRFRQNGDFVDFRTASLDVFSARLEAKGWASLAYAAGGFTWTMLPAVALNTELRYDQASTPMRGDFTGFDKTSLSGVALNTGLQFRF